MARARLWCMGSTEEQWGNAADWLGAIRIGQMIDEVLAELGADSDLDGPTHVIENGRDTLMDM